MRATLSPVRNQIGRWGLLPTLLLFAVAGCLAPAPGPPFEWAPAPPEHRARVYIYRSDDLRSLSVVKASIDSLVIGTFRNREYETFEIAPGQHLLRAGMRGFAYFNLGWNESSFQVGPGEVVYFQLELRIDTLREPALGVPRELEIGGRPQASVSENIVIIRRPAAMAAEDLELTRRLPQPD